MQRIRMSLPYFEEFGWKAEVVRVRDSHSDINKDALLIKSIPVNTIVHEVDAFSKKWTGKLGLGSIALRSLWHYKSYVDKLLKKNKYDLIYFSTTQFPVCTLGTYWKKKFGIPFVLDMQDPWHSDYYEDKPKNERPAKYWFSYRLNKYTERIAMQSVDGLISVSQAYLDELSARYEEIKKIPKQVITFGAFPKDSEIVRENETRINSSVQLSKHKKNIVYIGRGGYDMHKALTHVFNAFKQGLEKMPTLFSKAQFHFIGTSYASAGAGKATVAPLAAQLGIAEYVSESIDRVPFYTGLKLLQEADALLITGSDDPAYTASKIYPYLLTGKPILALFHPKSSAVEILRDCYNTLIPTFALSAAEIEERLQRNMENVLNGTLTTGKLNEENFAEFTARSMTQKQCALFEQVLTKSTGKSL